MDSIDARILTCLTDNSRMSAKAIGEEIHLSTSAVIERIRRMEAGGLIRRYTVVLDSVKAGCDITAFMSVSLDNPRHNDEFRKRVKACADITECYYMTGDYDYLLKIVTRDSRTLEGTLRHVKSSAGVSRTKTLVVLDDIKNECVSLPNIDKT